MLANGEPDDLHGLSLATVIKVDYFRPGVTTSQITSLNFANFYSKNDNFYCKKNYFQENNTDTVRPRKPGNRKTCIFYSIPR